eukprot:437265-Amorphochlora_amoeboformis.AAC.1
MAIETITQEENFARMQGVSPDLLYTAGKLRRFVRIHGTDVIFPYILTLQKEVPMPDDGPTFAMLAFILSIAMWAYEGGWVRKRVLYHVLVVFKSQCSEGRKERKIPARARSRELRWIMDFFRVCTDVLKCAQVAAVLSKGWTGFPTLLTVIQLVVG